MKNDLVRCGRGRVGKSWRVAGEIIARQIPIKSPGEEVPPILFIPEDSLQPTESFSGALFVLIPAFEVHSRYENARAG